MLRVDQAHQSRCWTLLLRLVHPTSLHAHVLLLRQAATNGASMLVLLLLGMRWLPLQATT